MSERVDALRAALEAAPGDSVLRVMLAEALAAEGRRAEALEEYELVSGTGDLGGPAALAAAELALDLGRFETAGRLLDVALDAGEIRTTTTVWTTAPKTTAIRAERAFVLLVLLARHAGPVDPIGPPLEAVDHEVRGEADDPKAQLVPGSG